MVSQENRAKTIEYVQNKYGFDHVAQIITYGKLQSKAVIRDIARVLQMPYSQADKISKMIPPPVQGKNVTLKQSLEMVPELEQMRTSDPQVNKLFDIAMKLEGLYRHSGVHAAGVVIGDRPLDQLVPLYKDPRAEMPVTQYDMKYVEETGLIKFDFLGLKTLTVIKKAVFTLLIFKFHVAVKCFLSFFIPFVKGGAAARYNSLPRLRRCDIIPVNDSDHIQRTQFSSRTLS